MVRPTIFPVRNQEPTNATNLSQEAIDDTAKVALELQRDNVSRIANYLEAFNARLHVLKNGYPPIAAIGENS